MSPEKDLIAPLGDPTVEKILAEIKKKGYFTIPAGTPFHLVFHSYINSKNRPLGYLTSKEDRFICESNYQDPDENSQLFSLTTPEIVEMEETLRKWRASLPDEYEIPEEYYEENPRTVENPDIELFAFIASSEELQKKDFSLTNDIHEKKETLTSQILYELNIKGDSPNGDLGDIYVNVGMSQ